MHQAERTRFDLALTLVAVGLGGLCVYAFFDTGRQYRGFEIPQRGTEFVDVKELGFFAMYALWGSLATCFFAWALLRSSMAARILAVFERARRAPHRVAAVAALLVFVSALAFRAVILSDQPVTDDETTYLFEAQTLLQGRFVNPPPEHPDFWRNQFVVLNERAWAGKYPIGHPLVLALGEALGARFLVAPVIGLFAVLMTFAIGRRLFGPMRALLGACLLLLSPQFVWTHGTQLSQVTSGLLMLCGVAALLRLSEDGRTRWAALAGAAFGLCCLARPFPGALFTAAALVAYLVEHAKRAPLSKQLLHLGAAAPFVLAAAFLIGLVNYQMTGSPLESGYSALHGSNGLRTGFASGLASTSFAGALIRQNFWLFGWTLSLAFVPFARPVRARTLFWGMIVAEYSYRLLVPKTVVSITGPIYVFEIVPLLALATADGAARVADLLGKLGGRNGRAWIAAGMIAASVVALLIFVPVQLRAPYASSVLRNRVYVRLEELGVERAIVFANYLIHIGHGVSWAYFPPNPSPTLDDDILFARRPGGRGGPKAAYDFWRQSYKDRRAFFYFDSLEHGLVIAEIDADRPPAADAKLGDYVRALQRESTEPPGEEAPSAARGLVP